MNAITVSESRRISAPVDRVWSVIADYGFDSRWRRGVVEMSQSTPGTVAVGTTTDEKFVMLGQRMRNLGVVTSVVAGRRFEWCTTSGTDAEGSREVLPLGYRACMVQLTLTSRPSGLIEKLLRPFIRSALQRSLRASLAQLNALVTSLPVASPGTRAPS